MKTALIVPAVALVLGVASCTNPRCGNRCRCRRRHWGRYWGRYWRRAWRDYGRGHDTTATAISAATGIPTAGIPTAAILSVR